MRLPSTSVPTTQYPNHIYTKPLLPNDSPASRTEHPKHRDFYFYFPCSADHDEQNWQPYPVDPSLALCDDHIYIYIHNTVIHTVQHTNIYYWNKTKNSSCCCLKKRQNAPRPHEYPPVRVEKMSKRLGGIKGCK